MTVVGNNVDRVCVAPSDYVEGLVAEVCVRGIKTKYRRRARARGNAAFWCVMFRIVCCLGVEVLGWSRGSVGIR